MSPRQLFFLLTFAVLVWTALFLSPTVSSVTKALQSVETVAPHWEADLEVQLPSGVSGDEAAPDEGGPDAACQSAATGNWSAAGTWTGCGGTTPQSTDTVEIMNTHTVTLDTNATVASTTIDAGGILTEDNNGRTLTISSGWLNNGTFTANTSLVRLTGDQTITGGTAFNNLEFNAAGTRTFTIASGTYATTTGTLTISGAGRAIINTGNIDAQGDITITNTGTAGGGTATTTINGTGTQVLTGPTTLDQGILPNLVYNKTSGTFSATGNITVQNFQITAGTFTSTSGTLEVKGVQFNTSGGTFTHNSGSVKVSTVSTAMTITGSQTFNNLEFSGGSYVDFTIAAGTTLTVNGTLSLTAGRRINTGNISAKGDITQASAFGSLTCANSPPVGGTATITLNGSGTQTYTISGGRAPKVVFDNASATASPSADVWFNTLTLTAGTYNGGSINTSVCGFTRTSGTFNGNTGTVTAAGTQTFTSGGATLNNFTISSGTATLGSALDADGNLTIDSGTTLTTSGSNYNVNVAGNWTNNGTYTSGANTTTFDGSGNSTITTGGTGTTKDFNNFTINKTGGGVATLQGPLDVDGTLTVSSGTLDLNTYPLSTVVTCNNSATFKLAGDETVSCTPTNNSGSTVEYGATTTTRNINNWTYDSLKINGSGGTFTSGADETLSGNLTVSAGTLDISTGSRTFNASSTLTVNGGTLTATNATLNVDRDVSLTSGTLTAPTSNFIVKGNWANTGGTFTHSSGTVTFASTSAQTLNSGGSTFNVISHSAAGTLQLTTNPLYASSTIINSAGTLDANAQAVTADGLTTVSGGEYQAKTGKQTLAGLTVSGGTFTGSSGTVDVNGNLTLSSGTLTAPSGAFTVTGNWSNTGGTFTPGNNTVTFDGTASGKTINSGGASFGNVAVNGTGGVWTLDTSELTASQLTLSSGTLTVPTSRILYASSTVSVNGGTLTATDGTLYADGDVSITSGTLTAPSATTTIYGHWAQSGGTFTHSSGAVAFASSSAQTLDSGGAVFNTLAHSGAGTLQLTTNSLYASSTIINSAGTLDANAQAVTADGLTTVSGGTYQAKTGKQTLAGLTVSGGTFTGSSGTVDVNGNLTLSSGTLTAPSGAFTVTGNWSKTGGTFTPGANTVTFDGITTGKTIDGGGTAFSNLTVNGTGGAWSVDTTDLILNQLSLSAGTLTVPTSRTLNASSTITVGGGTLTAADGTINADGNVSITSGTFTAPSGTLTVKGNWSNTGGTFTHSSGTVTFASSSAQTLTGETFYNLTINNSHASPDDDNDVDSSAAVNVANTLTVTDGQFQPTTASDFAGVTIASSGILKPDASANITVSGDWSKTGTFTHNSGTVTLDGTAQTLTGATTFNNLKSITAGDTLTFPADTTTTVAGTLTLEGASGNNITLQSSGAGTNGAKEDDEWDLAVAVVADAGGNPYVEYVTVYDNDATGAATPIQQQNSTDGGNNTGWGFDATAPVRSAGSPSGALAAGTTQTTLSLTTDETATCKYGTTANTAYASIANTFTTTGSTAHSQAITGLQNGQTYNYYVRCQDSYSNANTDDYTISFSVAAAESAAGTSGGGASSWFPGLPAPAAEPLKVLLEKIKQLPTIIKKLPALFLTKPTPPPLAEELISQPVPLALSGQWPLLITYTLANKPFIAFTLAPLPEEFGELVARFPALEETLTQLGISRLGDLGKMAGARFTLPETTARPSEVIFVQDASGLIEYPIDVRLTAQGKLEQSIKTLSQETLQLVLKPEGEARQVSGYLVLAGGKQISQGPTSFFSRLLASPFFAFLGSGKNETKPVVEQLLLASFEYQGPDALGLWTAEVKTPAPAGEYEIITIIDYVNVDLGKKELRLKTVVDPEGYVYEKIGGRQLRLPDAEVTLYWQNPETQTLEPWLAADFYQQNPQTTDVSGTYSFLVSAGRYYLAVSVPGYLPYQSEIFTVRDGTGVHQNIELHSKWWWRRVLGFVLQLLP